MVYKKKKNIWKRNLGYLAAIAAASAAIPTYYKYKNNNKISRSYNPISLEDVIPPLPTYTEEEKLLWKDIPIHEPFEDYAVKNPELTQDVINLLESMGMDPIQYPLRNDNNDPRNRLIWKGELQYRKLN